MSNHYVCVTGGRDFSDGAWVDEVIRFLAVFYGPELRVIHGKAKGADALAEQSCDDHGVRTRGFPADWNKHGPKRAGMIRNVEMAEFLVAKREEGHTVQVIAFPGGSGTQGMIGEAEKREIPVDRL